MANEKDNTGNGWGEYSKLVLKELESLATNIEKLSSELHEVRKDILRLETKESKVDELKVWKDKVDDIFSPSQMKELCARVSDHEAFKTKAVTVFAIVQFLVVVAGIVAKYI
jgi:predicted nuclease with TOPRIM domain